VRLLNDDDTRFVAGCLATGGILAAGHNWPFWRPLGRIGAYTFGCVAILIGQGILMKFNRDWRRLCVVVLVGGSVVYGSYWYDALANAYATRSGGRGNVV
jgi:hypothetical protein